MIRVLSIDGGGIRGIIPATVLVALEKASGRRIYELFDVIVGTSTGGILALALTCPQRGGVPKVAEEIRAIYLEQGGRIFPLGGQPLIGPPAEGNWLMGAKGPAPEDPSLGNQFKNKLLNYTGIARNFAILGGNPKGQGNARYPAEPLEQVLRQVFGESLMSQALRPVAVVSCDLATKAPLVFRGGGLDQGDLGDAHMKRAARATSAGPTFFQPLKYQDMSGNPHVCVDGGLVANDPSFVAYTAAVELMRTRGGADGMILVSLGTGQKTPGHPPEADDVRQLANDQTWFQLAPHVAATISSSGAELLRQQLSQLLGPSYVRLQAILGFGAVHAMDNALERNREALLLTGESLVRDNAELLTNLAGRLSIQV